MPNSDNRVRDIDPSEVLQRDLRRKQRLEEVKPGLDGVFLVEALPLGEGDLADGLFPRAFSLRIVN